MKRKLLLIAIAFLCLLNTGFSQPNIFNPNDPVVNYNSSAPPPTPAPNTLAKWVRTPHPNITFGTEGFKSYYFNGMPFRLRFPNGYNPADPNKKYPVILFFHGIGELAPVTDNELQLYWGALEFQNMINAGLFDAFLFFPTTQVGDWSPAFPNVNKVLDSMQKYVNADPDRIIAMGLSLGGDGAMKYTFDFPKRAAVSIPSSPGSVPTFVNDPTPYVHVPIWITTGGLDKLSPPPSVQAFSDRFKGAGGDIRWKLYPDNEHGTWLEHWKEPELLSYWNAAHKANPLVFFQQNQFPQGAPINAKIGITAGFAQYEWQRNNVTIPGAGGNEIIATDIGSYRVRFRREAGSNWSDWSPNPAVISRTTSGPTEGLNYRYYEGSFNALPDFNSLPLVKSGNSPNVDLGIRDVDDNFAVIWEGNINITTPGIYTFETVSDDGSKLYFNTAYTYGATALVNNDGLHGPTLANGYVNITAAGIYPIAITYFEKDLGHTMEVYWSGPGFLRERIPNSAFTSATTPPPPPPGNGLNYRYYEGVFNSLPDFNALPPVKSGNSANVDLGIRNVNDNFAVIWEGNITITTPGTYTFETVSDDGSKLYFNTPYAYGATATVNNDGLHAPTSASGTVQTIPAGTYSIAITFFEQGGGETMEVYWSGPGISRQRIPNSVFTTGTPPPPPPPGNGLNYRYYEGVFNSLPDFNALPLVKSGNSVNVDLGIRNVNDNFAVIWEGNITITTPGTYTFETISDDGSKLYFNTAYAPGATALVNNDGLHAAIAATGTVNIPAAGTYPIAITFFEQGGGETMEVYWTGPGISRQRIPNSAFSITTTPPPPANGLNYRYFEGVFNTLPNFNTLPLVKSGKSPNVDLGIRNVNDNFAVIWEGNISITTPGTYIFETVSDDGSRLYFNNPYSPGATPLVDNDGLHAPTSVSRIVNIPVPGLYQIAITYFEQGFGETMEVYWTGPGISRQRIPNSVFSSGNLSNVDVVRNIPDADALMRKEIKISEAYPNPFRDGFNISVENAYPAGNVTAQLFDVTGRLVHSQNFGELAGGKTILRLNPGKGHLTRGIYFVKLFVDNKSSGMIRLMKR